MKTLDEKIKWLVDEAKFQISIGAGCEEDDDMDDYEIFKEQYEMLVSMLADYSPERAKLFADFDTEVKIFNQQITEFLDSEEGKC